MNDVSYWRGQLDRLQANPPKKSESYYNKSFVDRMNEAKADIDGLVKEKDKSWAATQQAQDDYETFKGSMTTYNDAYKNALSEFGVEQAGADYEKNKKALAMTEMTLEALPSQINARSNVVLTQAQRDARYNVLANQFTSAQANQIKQNKTYEEAWKNAREKASANAQAIISSENAKMQDYNNDWIISMNRYNDAERKWSLSKANEEWWGAKYRSWQADQANRAIQVYIKQLDAALQRFNSAMETQIYATQRNIDSHDLIQDYIKEKYAGQMIDSYYSSQKKIQAAKDYDVGGILGKAAFIKSGMKL